MLASAPSASGPHCSAGPKASAAETALVEQVLRLHGRSFRPADPPR